MPESKQSWSDYVKQLAAGQLGIAAAYALKPKKKKKKKPAKKQETVGTRAGKALKASRDRYEQAARMSRGM